MKIYNLHSVQRLPIKIDTAWDFFSNPQNLKTITPDYMGFIIKSGADKPMFPGQIIQYTVTPLFGIKMKWVTQIMHVIPKQYFVDEQLYGPYALWHHKHFFKEIPNGVEMEDNLDYKLPYGFLGQMMHPFIKSKIEAIFEFRRNKLTELFGEYKY